MVWTYYNGSLMSCVEPPEQRNLITVEMFEHLTGKKINWALREFTKVTTKRIGGHIKTFDEKFIKGESYKLDYKIYKCEHVNESGIALLIPRGNALKAITARDAEDWEIV